MPLLVNFLLTKIINNRKKIHDTKCRRYSKKAMGKFTSSQMKKRSEETQTLRAGCSKVEPKIFAPQQIPSWGCGTAKI